MFPTALRKILIVPLMLPTLLGAVDLGDHFRLNGFTTIGASTVLESGHEFRAYTYEQDGVRQGEVNFAINTLFGLQGEAIITDRFTATVQAVAYNTRSTDYDVKADWAYLSYVTDMGLVLRAGKFRLPLFNSSELTYVGYARDWVRPALPFYGIAGFEHYTGGDLIYHVDNGAVRYGFEFGFGLGDEQTATAEGGTRHFTSNDLMIAKATADGDNFHAGLTYFRGNANMTATNASGAVLTKTTTLSQMLGTEGELDLEDLTLQGGIGYGWTQNTLPNELLAYAGASYQIDAWRPYLLYATKAFDHKTTDRPAPPPGAPPPPPFPGYVAENTFSLGVRYDFAEQADVKLQVDRIYGMQYVPQLLISDNQNDRTATVITAVVDLVF
jgi:hypothetical protein